MKHRLSIPIAVAAAALVAATSALAAETPKDMIFANKFTVAAKVVQAENLGKNGEAFVLIDEQTTVGDGSDHKMHCLGVIQGANGSMVEERQYCVETDPGGDQVLWKVTPQSQPGNAPGIPAVHEAIAGTGKYAGISMTIRSTCRVVSHSPTGFSLSCDGAP